MRTEPLEAVSIKRCRLSSVGIPMFKIRRSHDRLIFNMGIPYLGKTVYILSRALVRSSLVSSLALRRTKRVVLDRPRFWRLHFFSTSQKGIKNQWQQKHVLMLSSHMLNYMQYNRNTAWLSDTVRQTSRGVISQKMRNKSHWIQQRIYRLTVCNRRAFAFSRRCWVSRSRPRVFRETITVISLWRHNSGPCDKEESIAAHSNAIPRTMGCITI